MSERPQAATPDWQQSGSLYLTLSLLVEHEHLREAVTIDDLAERFRDAAAIRPGGLSATIDPMFDDIADRERQIFSAETLLDAGDEASPNAAEDIDMQIPGVIRWCTEGTTLAADFGADWSWDKVRCRYFWFLHSNRDLSYHVSLELRYDHRLRDYYALALMQKVLFPSEASPTGYPLRVMAADHERALLTDFLRARFNQHFPSLLRRHGVSPATRETADRRDDWACLIQGLPLAGAAPSQDSPEHNSVVASGPPRFSRAAFLLKDACFDHALRNREAVLDALTQAMSAPTQANDPKQTVDPAQADETARAAALRELAGQQAEETAPADAALAGTCAQLTYGKAELDALENGLEAAELALVFLSGFLQNIIDFLRQDLSEFADGTDPLYPERLEDDAHFLLYASQETMYEVVSRSRSLEKVGCKCIGSCPYLFLVHVTLFHDEALLRRFEQMVEELVGEVENKTGRYRKAQELGLGKMKSLVSLFQEQRLAIFGEVDKYMHLNVFRYDTEETFYNTVTDARGIGTRQQHWTQVMAKLGETIDGFHTMAQQRADGHLNLIVLLITVFSIFQVLFGVTQALRGMGNDALAALWDDRFINAFVFALVVLLPFGIWKLFIHQIRPRLAKLRGGGR